MWTKAEYERDGVVRQFPYCDYHITAASAWNYAFAKTEFIREEHPVGEIHFAPDEPPVTICASMAPIPWAEENGACTPIPQSTEPLGAPVRLRLIPYGCTTLRMTEMPLLKQGPVDEGEK